MSRAKASRGSSIYKINLSLTYVVNQYRGINELLSDKRSIAEVKMSNVVTDERAWLAATGIARARGVFITATDTGAGKTWVSRRLIAALRARMGWMWWHVNQLSRAGMQRM